MSYDIKKIKNSISDWRTVMESFGVDSLHFTGRSVPCPECGGDDRFQWSNKHQRGYCRQCTPNSKDPIDIIQGKNNWDFQTTVKELAKYLGIDETKSTHAEMIKIRKNMKIKKYLRTMQYHCLVVGNQTIKLSEKEYKWHGMAMERIKQFRMKYPNYIEVAGI